MLKKLCPQCGRLTPESFGQCLRCQKDLTTVTEFRGEPESWLSPALPGNPLSWLMLVVAQVLAVLLCVASPCVAFYQYQQLSRTKEYLEQEARYGNSRAGTMASGLALTQTIVVTSGIVAFCLSWALAVVFHRVRALPQIATQQDVENRDVWLHIATLRLQRSPPDSSRKS